MRVFFRNYRIIHISSSPPILDPMGLNYTSRLMACYYVCDDKLYIPKIFGFLALLRETMYIMLDNHIFYLFYYINQLFICQNRIKCGESTAFGYDSAVYYYNLILELFDN